MALGKGLGLQPIPRKEGWQNLTQYLDFNFLAVERAVLNIRRRIVGTYGISRVVQNRANALSVLGTGAGFISGASAAVTSETTAGTAIVTAVFDVEQTVVGAGIFIGSLQVFYPDGSNVIQSNVATWSFPTTARGTVAQQWVVPINLEGVHTFALLGQKSNAGGTMNVYHPHSNIIVQLLENP